MSGQNQIFHKKERSTGYPLYRLEQEFKRYGLAITRQNMANWMIRLGEEYIAVMWDYLHELLYLSLIHI